MQKNYHISNKYNNNTEQNSMEIHLQNITLNIYKKVLRINRKLTKNNKQISMTALVKMGMIFLGIFLKNFQIFNFYNVIIGNRK